VPGRPGRPPLSPRVRAAIVELHELHPSWGVRRLAAETGASRESCRRVVNALKAALASSVGAGGAVSPPSGAWAWAGASEAAGSGVEAPLSGHPVPMTDEDHEAWGRRGSRGWSW
jgi:hypothetical protein